MLLFFQRHLAGIYLLLISMLGISLGFLAATGLEIYLSPAVKKSPPSAQRTAPSVGEPSLQDFEVITRRNIFDSTAQVAPALTKTSKPSEKAERTPASRSDLVLFGTVTAGENSRAVIKADREIDVYRLEDELPGGGTIEKIERNLVHIRNADGAAEILALHEEGPQRAKAVAQKETGYNIQAIDENRWIIPRSEAEKARSNIGQLLKQARMEPRVINGKTEGFTVRMIRPKSLLSQMGIKRGDVILQINDTELDSPEKALQIFQQLREARRITLGLLRKGESLTFEYEVD